MSNDTAPITTRAKRGPKPKAQKLVMVDGFLLDPDMVEPATAIRDATGQTITSMARTALRQEFVRRGLLTK